MHKDFNIILKDI